MADMSALEDCLLEQAGTHILAAMGDVINDRYQPVQSHNACCCIVADQA